MIQNMHAPNAGIWELEGRVFQMMRMWCLQNILHFRRWFLPAGCEGPPHMHVDVEEIFHA